MNRFRNYRKTVALSRKRIVRCAYYYTLFIERAIMEFKNLCKNLHHIGIIVQDIEKELKLYQGILGYEIERDTGEKGLEKEYASVVGTVTGTNAGNARIVYLRKSGVRVELIKLMEL